MDLGNASPSLSANNFYLEHQYEQQQRAHHDVYLTLSGQRVEVGEGVPRMLQERRPLLLGHGAAAQVEPANRRCQSQFTDAQKSPGWQQVGVTRSEEAHDATHQEVQHQSQEDQLRDRKAQRWTGNWAVTVLQRADMTGGWMMSSSEGFPSGITTRRSCRSRPVIGHRVTTKRSRLDWARSETGNSNRKEKTARRSVLML